ncbi:hypothetical protein [Colwellia sp. C1TZA3]|uniref:hypothetical protein n=1 Tax=Colwellia sp. C1TZA3 TaxID=2508879 RepID=UPI0011BA0CF3|nr:hypothetical protein [Colwellia sp. C1TZA3]TWX72951.1 hypothetical protein ESZ39_06415 [Colwellia sp. C1TZA3]
MNQELHLFIIWEKARVNEREMMRDLKSKFEIVDLCEVTWSEKHFSRNLTRFYGEKLPKGSHKERHCGTGPFLVIVVRDLAPNYSNRKTSKNRDISVNTNVFDLKEMFRRLSGGGHKIHATNDIKEFKHDIALLFGIESENYFIDDSIISTAVRKLECDLIGADGWNNIVEFFYVLNHTIDYIVMRNFECLPHKYNMESHGDIDLLVSDYNECVFVTNAERVFKSKRRVHNKVNIGGEDVLFDFRFVGDEYYDKLWEEKLLATKVFSEYGYYRPENEAYFYSLLYHGMVHKPFLSLDYQERLIELGNNIGINKLVASDFDGGRVYNILSGFLMCNSFIYSEPYDLTVYFNEKFVGKTRISRMRRTIVEVKNVLRPFKNPIRLLKDIVLWIREFILRIIT